MPKKYFPSLLFILLLLAQMACSAATPAAPPDTLATLDSLYTIAAQTSTAAQGTPVSSSTPGLPQPTATYIPVLPTNTFAPPPATVAVSRCDAAVFIEDRTIRDGSVVTGGATFTKTWRLQNVGTCTWTPAYALVFVNGDGMSGPAAQSLTENVHPGQFVDVSVFLKAPDQSGHYRGYWKLRNAANSLFGIGAQAETAFWVDILVNGPTFVAYDFDKNYCKADWENNKNPLDCPGEADETRGFVQRLDEPQLETGAKSAEPGLLTHPKNSDNGLIMGTFPAFDVKAGDRFQAQIGCQYKAEQCDVTFRLDFKSEGQVITLGTWHEIYEGKSYTLDLDLSALAGKTGKFILVVSANGAGRDDDALWINPRIMRPGTITATPATSPTPSQTATLVPTPTPLPTFTASPTATASP